MAKIKTWVWVLIGIAAAFVLCIVAIAGAGVYFFTQHVQTSTASADAATKEFDAARLRFKGQAPLLRLDSADRAIADRRIEDLPGSTTKPQSLNVLAWNPDRDHLVRVSIPFWLLRLGRRNMNINTNDRDFNFDRLNLNAEQLDRVGPILILDSVTPVGQRVLVWTQ
jgi:hypothetical protein